MGSVGHHRPWRPSLPEVFGEWCGCREGVCCFFGVQGCGEEEPGVGAGPCSNRRPIGSIDAKGVTSAADYAAVNAALGKVIASVPTGQVMDVYNAFAKIVPGQVPNMLFNSVNPLDANAAAKAFYTFKDAVKAAQR